MNKMKISCYFLLLLCACCSLQAQVTIGSNEAPRSGSLLDLKDRTGIIGGADNATKGLGMPRLKLTDKNKLHPILPIGYNSAEDAAHTGLVVYHTDKCTMQSSGLYVWSGAEWEKLGNQSAIGLNLSPTTLDFPSGQDLRGAVSAKTFDVSWTPSGASVAAPTWTFQAGNYGQLNFVSLTPASGSLSSTSPQTMDVLPAAMTAAEVATNPFLTKDRKLRFTLNQCGGMTKEITVSQTNKALRVNGSSTPAQIIHATNVINQSISVNSNAKWKMSMTASTAVVNLHPAVGTVTGVELSNSASQTESQRYDIAAGIGDSRYTTLTFGDNESPKRFEDVKITIAHCSGTLDPSMQQWASMLGTQQDEIAPNGVAWHRDQEGNIFFSMNFDASNPRGSNNRWMTNNVTATSYAASGRTGSDATVRQNFGTSPSNVLRYNVPLWGYPRVAGQIILNEAASTEFKNRPRLGRLYNWSAATNSVGGTVTGHDYPPSPTLNGAINYPTHLKIQGICPNGWHLPSDWEWTELENVMLQQTVGFSSTPNLTPGNANTLAQSNGLDNQHSRPSALINGTAHGQAMVDICEPTAGYGTSNSLLNGGFSALFPGVINQGLSGTPEAKSFGINAYFWSSSMNSTSGWARALASYPQMSRWFHPQNDLYSVRCKKD